MIPTIRIQHKVAQFRFDGLRPTTLPSDGVVDIVMRVPIQDMRVDDVDGPLGPSEILGDLTKPSIPGDDGESYFSLLDIFVHLTELQYHSEIGGVFFRSGHSLLKAVRLDEFFKETIEVRRTPIRQLAPETPNESLARQRRTQVTKEVDPIIQIDENDVIVFLIDQFR